MKYLVFDIECVPNDEAKWEPPEDQKNPFPPPCGHKIVSIAGMLLSVARNSTDPNKVLYFGNFGEPNNEILMLTQFLDILNKANPILVSYYGRGYDIPVIEQRCMRWGIQAPSLFTKGIRNRYQGFDHFDLVDQIGNFGAARIGKLDNNCAALGMPGKMDVDGTQVSDLIAAGKQQEIDSYCLCDVAETAWLLVRYLHLKGEIADVTNYNAVHAIRSACIDKDDPMLTKLVKQTNIDRLSLEEQEPILEKNGQQCLLIPHEEEEPDLPF